MWESGYHIYEADSAEEALEMYESEREHPSDIEYTGWIDQEYRYDELDDMDGFDDVDQLNNNSEQIQYILRAQIKREEAIARYNKENPDV